MDKYIGYTVIFEIGLFNSQGDFLFNQLSSVVKRVIINPLNPTQIQYVVEIDNVDYPILIENIKIFIPPVCSQLTLF